MRWNFLILVVVLISCGAHHGRPFPVAADDAARRAELSEADRRDIFSLVEDLGKSLADNNPEEVKRRCDVESALAAIGRSRLVNPFTEAAQKTLRGALELKMTEGLTDTAVASGWTLFTPRSVRPGVNENEAVVSVRVWTEAGAPVQLRFWVARTNAGWRIFDWEDDELPIRMTTIVGMLYSANDPEKTKTRHGFGFLIQAAQCLNDGEFEKAAKLLERLEDTRFPASVDGFRWLLCALVELARDKLGLALEHLGKAEKLAGHQPSISFHRAMALARANALNETLEVAEDYLNRFGDDAEMLALMGDALTEQGKHDQAIACYRRGLADDDSSVSCLLGLSAALSSDQRSEVAMRFERSRHAADIYSDLAAGLIEQRDDETLGEVIAAGRMLFPEETLHDFYEVEQRILKGENESAAELAKAAYSRAKGDEIRHELADKFVEAMLLAKKPFDAYANAPETSRAFRAIARRLTEDEDSDSLERLNSLHRRKAPDDLWLPYYDAALHALRKQYDLADKAIVIGMKAPLDDSTREAYRKLRVKLHFLAGQAVRALKEISPEKQTFDQLARLAADAEQDAVLQTLIDLHTAVQPDDADLGLWVAEVQWLRREYSKAAQTLEKHRLLISGRPSNTEQYADRMVRSLVRSGQIEAAIREAQVHAARTRDPLYLAIAHSGEPRPEAMIEAIRQCLRFGYELESLKSDPEIDRALRSPAARRLLKKVEEEK